MSDLKPCPFCGNKVDIEFYVDNVPFTFVACYKCEFKMTENLQKLPEVDPEQAIIAKEHLKMRWNRRAGEQHE